MKDIEEILDNITDYDGDHERLFADLKEANINTFDQFADAARSLGVSVPKSMRDIIKARLDNFEEEAWTIAKSSNLISSLQDYLDRFPEGIHREEARCIITSLRGVEVAAVENDAWQAVDKMDRKSLENFIESYPDSPYLMEAQKILNNLRKGELLGMDINALIREIKTIRTDADIIDKDEATYKTIEKFFNDKRGKITPDDFLMALREDNNLISGAVANKLDENGLVSDFRLAGIDDDFIQQMLYKRTQESFPKSRKLEKITKTPCTEVYFWGIPSSGKSCALGAILSVASSGKVALSMRRDPDCQGYGYMTRLANLFRQSNSIGNLPEGTAITSTYEMGFDLEDSDGLIHPVTCIDLAGELIECMFRHDAGESLTEEQREVLNTMTNILIDNRTQNRKIHYFVIEYGAEDRLYKGLPQREYLDAAVAYINKTGIFKKETDAIYILVSKIDKAHKSGQELQTHIQEYLTNNYEGFVNGLKRICKENEIRKGKVPAQPFTLGNVCFQTYCKFDPETASLVVKKLLEDSWGYKPGKLEKIRQKLLR